MDKLAIAIRNYSKDNYKEIIDSIKKSGFKNVFIEWYNDDIKLQNDILNYVRKNNLNIIFAHLGYQNSNVIWQEGTNGDFEVQRYIDDIKICKENNIDLVVIHPTLKYVDPGVNKIGLNRIIKIIKNAEEYDVKVAFENIELRGYLEYIINNIDSKNVGICFDVGHYNVFYKEDFDLSLFKDRVFMIHLHDNYKKYDEHNLPFDGNLNWQKVIDKIKKTNYNGYIVIESGKNNNYENLSFYEFYSLAYEKGKKLVQMFSKKQ